MKIKGAVEQSQTAWVRIPAPLDSYVSKLLNLQCLSFLIWKMGMMIIVFTLGFLWVNIENNSGILLLMIMHIHTHPYSLLSSQPTLCPQNSTGHISQDWAEEIEHPGDSWNLSWKPQPGFQGPESLFPDGIDPLLERGWIRIVPGNS